MPANRKCEQIGEEQKGEGEVERERRIDGEDSRWRDKEGEG